MAKPKTSAETPIDALTGESDGAGSGDQPLAEQSAVAPMPAEPVEAADKAAAASAAIDEGGDDKQAELTKPSWKDHEEIPAGGGSFVRAADGSLTKIEDANETGADKAAKKEA